VAAAKRSKVSWLAKLWPKRLTLGFGVAVCTAVLITEIIFLIPAAYFWHKANEGRAVETVRMAWYHASDPAAFLTAEHKTRLGERMISDGLLLGGVVYDSAGTPLSVFGERPALDLNIARLSGVGVQASPNAPAIDVHLSPDDTGLAHHIIVRLPTEPIEAATFEQLRNFGLSVLFIAGLTAVLFIFASMLLVIRPLRAINKALRQAVENPDRADAYQLHMMRRDEIGQISGSLNMLLTSVSVVFQDELSSLKKAIADFGFGILQYDHEDRLIAANAMAIGLFKQDDFDGLRRMNRNCAQALGTRGQRPQPIVDLLGETQEPMLLTLHTDTGFFTAMSYCANVRRPDGSVYHRFVAIMPMDDILEKSRRAITDTQKAKSALRLAKVEAQEMRRLLESCLCLMEPPSGSEDRFEFSFLPDRILNGWYQEASNDELVDGNLEHGFLPPLSGDRTAIRNVLRQAMLLAYSQTEAEKPVLKVDAGKPSDGSVRFTISDVSAERGSVGVVRRPKNVDPTLPRAALQSALKKAGGAFIGMETSEGAVKVSFSLKGAKPMGMTEADFKLAHSA
jgi:hypothetical protein